MISASQRVERSQAQNNVSSALLQSSSVVDTSVSRAAAPVLCSQGASSSAKKASLADRQLSAISVKYPDESHDAIRNFFVAVVRSFKSNDKSSELESSFEKLHNTKLTEKQIRTLARQAKAMVEKNGGFQDGKNSQLSKFLDDKSLKAAPVVAISQDGLKSSSPIVDRPASLEVPNDVPKGGLLTQKNVAAGFGLITGAMVIAWKVIPYFTQAPAIKQPECHYSEAPPPTVVPQPMCSLSDKPVVNSPNPFDLSPGTVTYARNLLGAAVTGLAGYMGLSKIAGCFRRKVVDEVRPQQFVNSRGHLLLEAPEEQPPQRYVLQDLSERQLRGNGLRSPVRSLFRSEVGNLVGSSLLFSRIAGFFSREAVVGVLPYPRPLSARINAQGLVNNRGQLLLEAPQERPLQRSLPQNLGRDPIQGGGFRLPPAAHHGVGLEPQASITRSLSRDLQEVFASLQQPVWVRDLSEPSVALRECEHFLQPAEEEGQQQGALNLGNIQQSPSNQAQRAPSPVLVQLVPPPEETEHKESANESHRNLTPTIADLNPARAASGPRAPVCRQPSSGPLARTLTPEEFAAAKAARQFSAAPAGSPYDPTEYRVGPF